MGFKDAVRKLTPSDGPLVIATHNKGKLREIEDLFRPYGISAQSAGELNLAEPEETGTTYEENALIKAEAASKATGKIALSDDSGFSVYALDGAPGVYSADWAGEDRDFARAMRNVQEKVFASGRSDKSAQFVCVLCLYWPNGDYTYFRGEAPGQIIWPPRGEKGFGYDPMFIPDGHDITFGEMTAQEKHGWEPGKSSALSHRARAFELFWASCLRAD